MDYNAMVKARNGGPLSRLRELTKNLPRKGPVGYNLAMDDNNSRVVQYKDVDGVVVCEGSVVYDDGQISISVANMPEGTEFEEHLGDEVEIIVAYKGKLAYYSHPRECHVDINPGDVVRVTPGETRVLKAQSDVSIIGITLSKDVLLMEGSST